MNHLFIICQFVLWSQAQGRALRMGQGKVGLRAAGGAHREPQRLQGAYAVNGIENRR